MASFVRNLFLRCANFFVIRSVERLFKTPVIAIVAIPEKQNDKFWGNHGSVDVLGRRTQSHRRNRWYSMLRVLFVFGYTIHACTSREVECMENEDTLLSMMNTSPVNSPVKRHHNKRESTGRFAKLRKGGHRAKCLLPMNSALAARRRLVFDEVDENEPPSRRQTRSEKVQYILFHLFKRYFVQYVDNIIASIYF